MTFTVSFGWWIVPALCTITYLLWAALRRRSPSGGDYNFAPLFEGFLDLAVLVPVLVVWLLWSLFFRG